MTKKELQEQMDKMKKYYHLEELQYIEEIAKLKGEIRTNRLVLNLLWAVCLALAVNLILTWI